MNEILTVMRNYDDLFNMQPFIDKDEIIKKYFPDSDENEDDSLIKVEVFFPPQQQTEHLRRMKIAFRTEDKTWYLYRDIQGNDYRKENGKDIISNDKITLSIISGNRYDAKDARKIWDLLITVGFVDEVAY